MKIQAWIADRYPDKKRALNQCNVAVRALTERFCELTVQVGYANGRYHCWACDEAGNIIDPTAKQFDGDVKYTRLASRFLERDEIEPSTGAIFLRCNE